MGAVTLQPVRGRQNLEADSRERGLEEGRTIQQRQLVDAPLHEAIAVDAIAAEQRRDPRSPDGRPARRPGPARG